MITIYETKLAGYAIKLLKDKSRKTNPHAAYVVIYGASQQIGLSYIEAGHALGLSIMHALQCEGKLD